MTTTPDLHNDLMELDLIAIERQARAMQARVLADMFGALRRSVVGFFARVTQARTA